MRQPRVSWVAFILLIATPVSSVSAGGRPPAHVPEVLDCDAASRSKTVDPVVATAPRRIGITYFAGRSRSGDDAHLASALTTELAGQLRGAVILASESANGRPPRQTLSVRLSNGGTFTDVDLSLTGTIYRDQAGLRTDLRVTRTSDGTVVWTVTEARPIRQLPALARQLAEGVAKQIGVRLTASSPPPPSSRVTDEEYELLLRGADARAGYDAASLAQAVAFLDSASRIDSTTTEIGRLREAAGVRLLAWGGTGTTREASFAAAGLFRRVPIRPRDESEQLVEDADRELRAGRLELACRLLDRAIVADARSAPAFALRSLARARSGNVRDAFGDAETATQLGRPLWGDAMRTIVLLKSRDTTSAMAELSNVLRAARTRHDPMPLWDARFIAAALTEAGRRSEARGVLSRIDARDPRREMLLRDASVQGADIVPRRPRR